jgi:hypothetical protein
MRQALTYWPSGGDIVATHGRVIAPDEARHLRRLYLDEAAASASIGDRGTCARALGLVLELWAALNAGVRWRQAATLPYTGLPHQPSCAKATS